MSGSPAAFGRSEVPSFGQKRSPVSYSVPHCGQTLETTIASSALGVGCCASKPDPNALSVRCGSVTPAAPGAPELAIGSADGAASVEDCISESRAWSLDMSVKDHSPRVRGERALCYRMERARGPDPAPDPVRHGHRTTINPVIHDTTAPCR